MTKEEAYRKASVETSRHAEIIIKEYGIHNFDDLIRKLKIKKKDVEMVFAYMEFFASTHYQRGVRHGIKAMQKDFRILIDVENEDDKEEGF